MTPSAHLYHFPLSCSKLSPTIGSLLTSQSDPMHNYVPMLDELQLHPYIRRLSRNLINNANPSYKRKWPNHHNVTHVRTPTFPAVRAKNVVVSGLDSSSHLSLYSINVLIATSHCNDPRAELFFEKHLSSLCPFLSAVSQASNGMVSQKAILSRSRRHPIKPT